MIAVYILGWAILGALVGVPWAIQISKRNKEDLDVAELIFYMFLAALMGPIVTGIILLLDYLYLYLKHKEIFDKIVYNPNKIREDYKRSK